METCNRFCQYHNSSKMHYVACASTGKAAVNFGGTTVHSTFRISMSGKHSMSREALQMYRSAFHSMHIVLVDKVCMVNSDILQTVHVRLREITNEFEKPFGGMTIMF
jgi:hypothetical protein